MKLMWGVFAVAAALAAAAWWMREEAALKTRDRRQNAEIRARYVAMCAEAADPSSDLITTDKIWFHNFFRFDEVLSTDRPECPARDRIIEVAIRRGIHAPSAPAGSSPGGRTP